MIYPPSIEYETNSTYIKVSLCQNIDEEGNPLNHPLPKEMEIREKMIEFAKEIEEIRNRNDT